MTIPAPLFPGARVALVAPASAVPAEKLPPALDFVRSLGLEPVPYPSCFFANRDGYLAASDCQRAETETAENAGNPAGIVRKGLASPREMVV